LGFDRLRLLSKAPLKIEYICKQNQAAKKSKYLEVVCKLCHPKIPFEGG
jgi:hypothetical protein